VTVGLGEVIGVGEAVAVVLTVVGGGARLLVGGVLATVAVV
jgi:hypothetical protein